MHKLQGIYKDELETLKNGYHELNLQTTIKDDIIYHLGHIIREQDQMAAEFKLKTKRDIDNKLQLADFVDFG